LGHLLSAATLPGLADELPAEGLHLILIAVMSQRAAQLVVLPETTEQVAAVARANLNFSTNFDPLFDCTLEEA